MAIRAQFSTGIGFDAYSVLIGLNEHSWSTFTHVDIILPDDEFRTGDWLVGARSDDVKALPPAYENWAHTAIVELTCSPEV